MSSGPLAGIRVIDASTLFAGPTAAMILGDFGADVIKIEHPDRPDPVRTHGPAKDGVGLSSKMVNRNKSMLTLNLSLPEGQDVFRRLVADTDVVIENFRPGTLERWDLGYPTLRGVNPRLVLARVTAFGQDGPYSDRPGFGTLAEAMSGFAALTGQPDGPPTLPPFGLADGIAAMATALAVTMALRVAENEGKGQVVDLAIVEPIMMTLGAQMVAYDQLGLVPQRHGNRSANNAPRNLYQTSDDRWVAVSTSSQNIAERVVALIGRPELANEPWFKSASGRVAHVELLDGAVAEWIRQRTASEVLAAFAEAEAAAGPVYDVADMAADPQFEHRGTFVEVPDSDLGSVVMQNVLFRLSETPGAVASGGRGHGEDTDAIMADLGYTTDDVERLRSDGVI